MSYSISFSKNARKSFDHLPKKVQESIEEKVDALSTNPRPNGVEKIHGGEDLYRIRSGDYRIVYHLQDQELLILIVKIGHRREIYRRL